MTVKKMWIESPEVEKDEIDKLSIAINVNPVLSKILVQRGINNFEKAKNFFRPQLDDLHDPFLMKDMALAVDRIVKAINRKEKILVYGDYDVDGTTAVATMFSFLQSIDANTAYYIPDRYLEGYGISIQGIDFAKANDFGLVISLDCGIKAVDKIAYANEQGIDFIICDHHLPSDIIPDAVAVLDPKQKDCNYPFKELSGCGVGFKLIQAICQSQGFAEHIAYEYLDLLAVSIAADIVSVTGENRILAFYGLEKINFNPRPGIKAMLKSAAVKGKIEISHLVFQVSPRINAAGRIDHAHLAVKLLTAHNEDEADLIAQQVGDKNTRRKDFDQNITAEALNIIANEKKLIAAKTTVLYQRHWHKGVIGIVASRCIEQYYRPTIILTESNGKATGSARSVSGFNVHHAIEECADLLEQFGGHKYAAGLTLPLENVEAFQLKFEEVVGKSITTDQLIPKINIDSYIKIDQINEKFYYILSQMDPFGPDNMQPVFAAGPIVLAEDLFVMKDKHIKLIVKDQGGNQSITAVGFGMAALKQTIINNHAFEIAFTIQQNEYKGVYSLQLMLKDIRPI